MGDGELWKIPLEVAIPFPFEATVSGLTEGHFSLVLGGGRMKDETTTVTVFRLDRKTLRLRAHADRAVVTALTRRSSRPTLRGNLGSQLIDNLVDTKIVGGKAAGLLGPYLTAETGIDFTRRDDGQNILLEFYLDPTNPADQMDDLAKFVKGEISLWRKFASATGIAKIPSVGPADGDAAAAAAKETQILLDRAGRTAAQLGGLAPTYAALDSYGADAMGKHAHPDPLDSSSTPNRPPGKDHHIVVSTQNPAARVETEESHDSRSDKFWGLPFIGYQSGTDQSREARVYVDRQANGQAPLIAIYTQFDGYKNMLGGRTERNTAEKLNGIAKYVGLVREGRVSPGAALSQLDQIFPKKGALSSAHGKTSYGLLFGEAAVQQMLDYAKRPDGAKLFAAAYATVFPDRGVQLVLGGKSAPDPQAPRGHARRPCEGRRRGRAEGPAQDPGCQHPGTAPSRPDRRARHAARPS